MPSIESGINKYQVQMWIKFDVLSLVECIGQESLWYY